MDKYLRHRKTWSLLYRLLHRYIENRFNFSHDVFSTPGPCIVIPNHVTAWDPLLVAMSFPEKQMYFVASEHLFRKGLVTAILNYLVEPISRKKASMGADTVKACLRHLKEGRSICLFAEGEASWDGLSGKIFEATGKLVRISGASLVTYRIEGGYLSLPRWGKGLRRGRMKGGVVRCYSPEELKAMSPGEINQAIDRDIYEDAWQRQREEQTAFKAAKPAELLERGLFLCPECRRIGRLQSRGGSISCACGFSREYGEQGFFQPPSPFESFVQWDRWQHERLKALDFEHGEELFADEGLRLSRVEPGHREERLGRGRLSQREGELIWAGHSFSLDKINSMAMVQANILLFTEGDKYYELKAEGAVCLRKYLAHWENKRQ